jgi:S-layer protein (TIGR01567 family)
MVVGIGEILTFNRKCTIVVGLLFAVIFVAITVVSGQATSLGVDSNPPTVTITSPANLEIDVDIDTNITATFNESMNSSTLNNSTVKVYIQEKIAGETFENTVGTWNSTNFQGFIYAEQLMVWSPIIDDSHRTIGDGNITYSTQPLLKDYLIYTNEGEEVEGSGNYSVIGWLGDENVVIDSGSKWIISRLIFEQNSTDVKTLQEKEIWDLGDGYSFEVLEISESDPEAFVALYNSSGKIDDEVCVNQSPCIFTEDLGAADNSLIFVTYLNKVNLTHIELKYTWLISQDTITIQNGQPFGDFKAITWSDAIILRSNEDVILSQGDTIPLFDDYKFEVEDTSTVRYRLVHQAEPPLEGDVSYNSSSRTVTFDPVSNLNENTDYFPLITTGAEDLAGNGLTEDYVWTFRTIDATPTAIITQPEEGAYIRGTIDINGTANDTNFYNYTIEWKNTTVDWTEIHNSTVPVSDGTLATWNTDNLEDGDYSISLTVTDNASNSNITLINVTIDNTLPIIYSVSLNDNMVKIGDSVSIEVNATDAISNDLIVILHGINETGVETGNSTLEKIEPHLDLYGFNQIIAEDHPEGNMTLNISVSDEANNIVYNDSLNLTIDMTPPSVTSLSLSTLIPVIGESVNITANVDDTYLNTSSIFALINSPTETYELPMVHSINDEYYYNFTNTEEFGKYTITLSASDQAGNVNNSEITWFITVLPPFINNSINTTANNVTTIDALEEVDTTLELFTSNDTTNVSIEITMSNNIPPTLNQSFGIGALGKYISINVSDNLNDTTLTWAIIKIYYTQAELEASGLDESSLVFRYYNETSEAWEPVTPSGVNPATIGNYSGYVWANVSHFSDYAVGGELEVEETTPPSNGGGGGGGGGTPASHLFSIWKAT